SSQNHKNQRNWRHAFPLLQILPEIGQIAPIHRGKVLYAPDFGWSRKQREGVSPVALVFVILTAARFGEARLMQKREVDSQQLIWTVPAERMKAEKEHRVPLAKEVLELPGDMVDDDALAFLSTSRRNRPLSDMSLTALLKRMGRDDITVYGFRSIFRDWAGETTGHLREVIEHSFAQQAKDKAESAYAHGDSFIKRRRLMEDWARYLTSAMVQDAEGPNVVALSTQAAS
ncbi:MAG: tyrosine-type recombinase/integrase, partial [Pseudomonadota bacterium]